ncbi:MAG: hypothetical protein ACQETH_15500, partial [Candidatus Rifleibacteriota bacterium]
MEKHRYSEINCISLQILLFLTISLVSSANSSPAFAQQIRKGRPPKKRSRAETENRGPAKILKAIKQFYNNHKSEGYKLDKDLYGRPIVISPRGRAVPLARILAEFNQRKPSIDESNRPDTFFMIHFEVTSGMMLDNLIKKIPSMEGADTRNLKYQQVLWPTAIKLINAANRCGHKLTLAFNPQWAEYILNSEDRTKLLRLWQQQGHEVAFHNHGYDHRDWSGYSNRPEVTNDPRYRGVME